MPEYFWIPLEDKSWDAQSYSICHAQKMAVLPRAKDQPYAERVGSWADIKSGDTLIIAGHGLAKSSSQVGWVAEGEQPVLWDVHNMALAIRRKMTPGQRECFLYYKLWICWSGDSWFGSKSFGAKLASVMGPAGFNGQVIGYKGKVQIGGTRRLIVKGSGRFTSLFGGVASRDELDKATPKNDDVEVTVNKFNFYDAHRVQSVYPIP